MKRILCHFAQRNSRPTGVFANHVSRCRECEEFFEQTSSLESRLVTAPGEPDPDLCAGILAQISKAEPVTPDQPERAWIFSRGGFATALAFVMIGILAVVHLKEPAQSADNLAEQDDVPRTPAPHPAPELTLAYTIQQQELLQRDALRLGTHLREKLILFRTGDQ